MVDLVPVDGNPFAGSPPPFDPDDPALKDATDYASGLGSAQSSGSQTPLGFGTLGDPAASLPLTHPTFEKAMPYGNLQEAQDAFQNWPTRIVAGLGYEAASKLGGLGQAAWNAATLPGDVAQGRVDPNSDEAIQRSTDLAGMLTMPAAGSAVADPSALGIFAGAKSATADLGALDTAKGMAANGADRGTVWNQTGWFQGADGQWRYEIPDNAASLNATQNRDGYLELPNGNFPRTVLGERPLMSHQQAAHAYPNMQSIGFVQGGGNGENGFWKSNPEMIGLSTGAINPQSTVLHELQHAVQNREGFATGSNPANFTQEQFEKETVGPYDTQIQQLMSDNPDAAAAFQARNRYQAQLKDKYGPNWGHSATPDEYIQYGQLEDALHATPGGSDLDGADFDRSMASYRVKNTDAFQNWAMQKYRSAAGEVEARNVQARMNMTPEQRAATPPWVTQDTPDERQIVLRPVNGNPFTGTAMSIGDTAPGINWDRSTIGRGEPIPDHMTVVDLPTGALDAASKASAPDYHVATPKTQVANYAASGAPMSLPEIGATDGRIGFQNGRNRVAAALANGEPTVPVAVEKSNVGDVYNALRIAPSPAMNVANGAKAPNAVSSGMRTYHASWDDFDEPDFSRLGETTLPNVEGQSIEPWAMNLAKAGFWTSEKSIADKMGAPLSLPFDLTGNIKSYSSLDKVEAAIRKAGGPEQFRQQMIENGYSHAKVKDQEFGGTSYITFDPKSIRRQDRPAQAITTTPVEGNPFQ